MSAIKITNISKEFRAGIRAKRVKALENLSLEIEKGEVFGFLGPNGAGKSTTIKMLLNLIYPDIGSIEILGKDANEVSLRKNIGYLPESPFFYDYLTSEEILWFGARVSGMSSRKIKERTEVVLHKVDLLSARKRYLRTYSKGMLQRVGLALALIHDPQVVVLDEPMSGLDPIGRKMVGDIILDLKSQGKTVFFSSHILTDVERFCDRIGIIVGGTLTLADKLHTVLSGGAALEEIFLNEVRKAGGGIEA